MADIYTTKQHLLDKTEELIDETTNVESMAYAAEAVRKINEINLGSIKNPDIYTIGNPGEDGFGVAAIRDKDLPVGFTKLFGHEDITSPNYGNVLDANGSAMVWIPAFYYLISGNVVFISATQKTGYVLHRAFSDGATRKGIFVDKYGCGNIGGKFISKQGLDPCSTYSGHNPISNLNTSPANNYGGIYKAVQSRGVGFAECSIFIYNALALLAYAHGQASTSTTNCAFIDVAPKMPKGNLNNALKDYNDASVTFTSSGYSNCALTGSGVPFAKTTHNGQSSGVADLTGNMWEIQSGFIYIAETGASGSSGSTSLTFATSDLTVGDIIYFGGTPNDGSTYNTSAYTITAKSGNTLTLNNALERDIATTDGVYSSKYFRILKPTVATTSITNDTTSGGAYDKNLYDLVDLTGIVDSNSGWTYLGNSASQVFAMDADTNSNNYKKTSVGIPLQTGVSSSGTTQFGNDGIYRYLRNNMACISGGSWGDSSVAGLFAMILNNSRTNSHNAVGGRASYLV